MQTEITVVNKDRQECIYLLEGDIRKQVADLMGTGISNTLVVTSQVGDVLYLDKSEISTIQCKVVDVEAEKRFENRKDIVITTVCNHIGRYMPKYDNFALSPSFKIFHVVQDDSNGWTMETESKFIENTIFRVFYDNARGYTGLKIYCLTEMR